MLASRMGQWKQQWMLECEQRGEQKGRQLGEQRGEATLLLRQLERRFGVVPGWARDQVLAADTVTIEDWGLRVLDAASLEDVVA
jgi:hypothetical protein